MSDETKPIVSSETKSDRTIGTAPTENKRDTSGDQSTSVRALKSFHRDGDLRGDMAHPGDEFEVPRSRAAQLRANGLIEYTSEGDDHAIHGEVDAKRIGDKVKQQAEQAKIPENSRGKPLINPAIEMADAPPDTSAKRK